MVRKTNKNESFQEYINVGAQVSLLFLRRGVMRNETN